MNIKIRKTTKGITLISLVVTIVVLLILAGIALNLILGNNGILAKANDAKDKTTISEEQEQINLAKTAAQMDELGNKITVEDLQNELNNLTKGVTTEVIDNGDDTFQVLYKKTGNKYNVENDGINNVKPTKVYAKLYTDKTLIFSAEDYTDPNRTVEEDYGDVSKNVYYLDKTTYRLAGDYPGWIDNSNMKSKASNVIIYDKISPINTSYWFYYMENLTNLDLSNLDTSNVTDMSSMFKLCTSLQNINVSKFNTRNVTNMSNMFLCCGSMTNIDLSNFDTNNVKNMTYMFDGCDKATNINLSSFNTKNVTDMSDMFQCCHSLENLDLSSFNTENVTNMEFMFDNMVNLKSINVSSFNTSNVKNFGAMFQTCYDLKELDASNFTLDSATDIDFMFGGCNSQEKLDISNMEIDEKYDIDYFLSLDNHKGCNVLVKNEKIKDLLQNKFPYFNINVK